MLAKSWITAIVAAMAIAFAPLSGAQAADWADFADVGWYEAAPESTTFTINTAEELAGLAKLVNEGTETFAGKTVLLGRDIDLGGKEWTVIGINNKSYSFLGVFDGQGCTVGGLGVIKPYGEAEFLGLFGSLYNSNTASIRNLNITGDVRISQEYLDTIAASSKLVRVGALAGQAQANSTNAIENCTFKGSVKGFRGGYTGGLVGFCNITVRNCRVEADITTYGIDDSASTSDLNIGGICGKNENAVAPENCFFKGTIKAASAGPVAAGGICGAATAQSATITNCIALCDIDVSGVAGSTYGQSCAAGGIAGRMYYKSLSGCYAEGNVQVSSEQQEDAYVFAGGIVGALYDYNSSYKLSVEHCSSAVKAKASSGRAGGIVGGITGFGDFPGFGFAIAQDDFKIYQCEYLTGDGFPTEAIADGDGTDYTAYSGYSVTAASEVSALTPVAMTLEPVLKVLENQTLECKAFVYPSASSGNGSLLWTWGTADKSIASAESYENDKAVIRGIKEGASEVIASASGFLGENTWQTTGYLSVVKIMLSSLSLDTDTITLTGEGDTKTVSAELTPAEEVSYPVLHWQYEVVSGDGASAGDLELTAVDSSKKIKVSVLKCVPEAKYKLTAYTVDGSNLSASVDVTVTADETKPVESSGGSSGGCSAAGWGLLPLFAFLPAVVLRGRRKG